MVHLGFTASTPLRQKDELGSLSDSMLTLLGLDLVVDGIIGKSKNSFYDNHGCVLYPSI